MFRHRSHRRRWAARTLVLWLMSVVVGIANACLIPTLVGNDAHGVTTAVTAPAHQHGHGGVDSASPADSHAPPHAGQPAHEGSIAKTNCKDFCEKVAVSVAPIKSALDEAQHLAPPPLTHAVALPQPVQLPAQDWVPWQGDLAPPPIPIAFLRLAL